MLVAFLSVLLFSEFLNMNIGTVDGRVIKNASSLRWRYERDDEPIDVDDFIHNLPPNLKSHSKQAGGHFRNSQQNVIGMLEDKELGSLLKHIDGKRTVNELNFYQEVEDGKHPDLEEFLSAYRGIYSVPYKGRTVDFITLEDQTFGFKKPCVLDLKIGAITWDPQATPLKIESEKSKSATLKKKFGFAMPGYLVTHLEDDKKPTTLSREECRALKPEQLVEAIEDYVHTTKNSQVTAALVKGIIRKLQPIVNWASTQTKLRFVASSILILYDSEKLRDFVSALEEKPDSEFDQVKVKMIDFAHVYEATEDDLVDQNYLTGVQSLLEIFQNILMKHSNTGTSSSST